MMKLKRNLALVSVLPVLLTSCNQLGKVVAEGITETTNSLKGIACSVFYTSNLYPKSVKNSTVENMDKVWKEGANAITVTLAKKQGIGAYKLNGSVIVDNEPLPYIFGGAYSKVFEDNLTQKTIKLSTNSGDETSITINPPKPVNLVSVNGAKEEAEVDLNKDLYLEFDNFKNLDKNDRLKVSFLMDVLGIREFVDIGIFKPSKMLKIPAFAFKNLSVTASASGVAELKAGKNFIKVERYNIKKDRIAGLAASQAVSMSWATMPVNLVGNSMQNMGIEVKGETGTNQENFLKYSFNKPNAFYSKPFSKAKKFALYSLSVKGLLRDVQSFTSSSTAGGVTTTTTTTITRQFPQLPDLYWEQLIENSFKDITKILKDMNIDLIPVQRVTSSKEYGFLEEIDDVNTKYEIVKKYKNTKNLMPTSLFKIFETTSSTFASDRPESRLIDELGVDGLIGISIDLAVDRKSDLIKLVPRLTIRVMGGANGYSVGPVVYTNGYVTGAGTSFSESEFSNINALNRITRKDDMMKLLSKGLKDLIKKEKDMGYDAIWSLQ